MKFEDIKEVKIPGDFDEIVSILVESDGFVARAVIYNTTVATIMSEMGFASKNAKGSYGGTEKLRKLYKKEDDIGVLKAFKAFCREKGIKMFMARVVYDEVE